MYIPLRISGFEAAENLTEVLLHGTLGLREGLGTIGQGIGSVFIILVLMKYIVDILGGKKFEMSMLIPVAIYFCVCNFSLVAEPTIEFVSKLKEEAIVPARNVNEANAAGTSILDYYMQKTLERENAIMDEATRKYYGLDSSGQSMSDDEESSGGIAGWFEKTFEKIRNIPRNFTRKFMSGINTVGQTIYSTGNIAVMYIKHGVVFLFAVVLDFILKLVTFVITMLGALMTIIIVAFGPITWAFAVFPGNAGVLKSWFLRLCQFALYAPIGYLINGCVFIALKTTLEPMGMNLSAGVSLLAVIALVLANIVALTSVPAIASMVIEGASGSINPLSTGLQIFSAATIKPAMDMAKTVATAGTGVGAGGSAASAAAGIAGIAGGGAAAGGQGGGSAAPSVGTQSNAPTGQNNG